MAASFFEELDCLYSEAMRRAQGVAHIADRLYAIGEEAAYDNALFFLSLAREGGRGREDIAARLERWLEDAEDGMKTEDAGDSIYFSGKADAYRKALKLLYREGQDDG